MTSDRWFAVGILAVLLALGGWFVYDQLDFCGPRCTTGISDAADLDRLARQQGIARIPVPPCDAAGGSTTPGAWTAPGPVTALATAPDGVVFAAGPQGRIWTAPAGPGADGTSPTTSVPSPSSLAWTAWASAGEDVTAAGPVTALAVGRTGHLLVATSRPAQLQAFDLVSGLPTAAWALPAGADVRALAVDDFRLVAVDAGTGAAWSASLASQAERKWGPLQDLREPGELRGATAAMPVRPAPPAPPSVVVATPETLWLVSARDGALRKMAAGGAGADLPMTAEHAAIVRSALVTSVDSTTVLVDAGRARPAEQTGDWRGVGIGEPSEVPALDSPVAATGHGSQLVVADGDSTLAVLDAPSC